jgi:hypothetical protein
MLMLELACDLRQCEHVTAERLCQSREGRMLQDVRHEWFDSRCRQRRRVQPLGCWTSI